MRFFAALAQSVAMVFTGLMTRELGGRRRAQVLAALAAAISPMAVCMGTMLQYGSIDYLSWVLAAYFMIRLLRSKNPRWWLAIGAVLGLGMMTKYSMLAPINSAGWRLTSKVHDNFSEQIGWPELAETVAGIYAALPESEKAHAAILAGNYGEAGAVNLFGRKNGLPEVISGINTYWWRGYGNPPPEVVILVGFSRADAEWFANQVELAGHVTNPDGVRNEETRDHPDIFVCRDFKKSWPEFWTNFQCFG